ncbi:type II toxin-antitoxin system ParD family antitoxin [Brevundimonas diminuta]|uniref:type II toxin-antitoxin system ParD family antitoxin n=1 Tax=Brevundimonas diminuta TaxID=293 RepID=UPI0035E36345
MTMTVELGALEKVVENLVKQGRYGSKSEVLRTGVRLVQEHEARLAELLGKLEAGVTEAERGDVVSLNTAAERLRQRFELSAPE